MHFLKILNLTIKTPICLRNPGEKRNFLVDDAERLNNILSRAARVRL